ncbi:MAG: spore coat protein U domain-containing protein [Gammaproteobacteria bacterium]|nr:spore coat protein U domain-containing protein [Gammaproteobacteria bacterium]
MGEADRNRKTTSGSKALCGLSLLVTAISLLFAGNAAWAARTCTLTITNISFGTYIPAQPAPVNANGNVNVNCQGAPGGGQPGFYLLTLSAGNSGNFAQRHMEKVPGTVVTYNVYVDALYANVWGDGSPGTSLLQQNFPCGGKGGMGKGKGCKGNKKNKYNADHPAYGQADAFQDPEPGYYTDSLIVLLTF